MVRLVGEHGARGSAVGGKASVARVDVLAVGAGGLDDLVGIGWDARLHRRAVAPGGGGAAIAEEAAAGAVLGVHEGQHRRAHAGVVRRTPRLDERLAGVLQPQRRRDRQVALERAQRRGRGAAGSDGARERNIRHPKAERARPAVDVRREVREATQAERRRHQPQVLQHRPVPARRTRRARSPSARSCRRGRRPGRRAASRPSSAGSAPARPAESGCARPATARRSRG